MTDDPRAPYADYSGCGNTVRAANRAVRHLIRESLRYWVTEMHVDGFRFDLAAVAARGPDGSVGVDDPPLFGDLTIPELAGVRLIAQPWDPVDSISWAASSPGCACGSGTVASGTTCAASSAAIRAWSGL
jgi:isoamylase